MYSTYTVAQGDTMFSIARKFGMTVDDLTRINELSSTGLKVGQQLRVVAPAGSPATPPPAAAKPATGGSASTPFQVTRTPEGDFQRIVITVPNCGGQTIQARMRNNINYSKHLVYPEGVSYAGMSNVVPDVATVQQVGLTQQQAKALQYVSTHEGKFDAINSYDKAIFSYGFIQFAGAAAVGASLNRVMASMKQYASTAFNRIFQPVGIDVAGGVVTVRDSSGTTHSGDNAWLHIQKNLPLYGAFIQAGFDRDLVREQLRMANELYVQPALRWKLDVNVGGINVSVPKLSDILKSEAALTIVIALAINQGNGGMGRMVADAVGRVGAQQGLKTAAALAQVDERKVFETLAQVQTDQRVLDRTNGVLSSGLSFGKV
jgi:peptidoglycan endopeptidase LytF